MPEFGGCGRDIWEIFGGNLEDIWMNFERKIVGHVKQIQKKLEVKNLVFFKPICFNILIFKTPLYGVSHRGPYFWDPPGQMAAPAR